MRGKKNAVVAQHVMQYVLKAQLLWKVMPKDFCIQTLMRKYVLGVNYVLKFVHLNKSGDRGKIKSEK